MTDAIQWRARYRIWDDGLDVLVRTETHVASPVLFTLEPRETHALVEPTFRLTRSEAQQIMNELWREGFRPMDGAGTLAHVEAQKAHLEDLRRLVFSKGTNP